MFLTITLGFPNPDSTVPLLLALEAGGADIIELGIPFSDPISDGAVIQDSVKVSLEYLGWSPSFTNVVLHLTNLHIFIQVALSFDVSYAACLGFVKQARIEGLKAPVILMGQSLLTISEIMIFIGSFGPVSQKVTITLFYPMGKKAQYGTRRRQAPTASSLLIFHLKKPSNSELLVHHPGNSACVGPLFDQVFRILTDVFEIVDVFRLSYVPLIAPSSSDERIRILSSVADSFIYVVSKVSFEGLVYKF